MKVFLSYSVKDGIQASVIKKNLEIYALDVFLAHEDIKPSIEWQNEIFKKINECDIFIPLLSNNFKDSKWTDQETGIAYALNKMIISISLDKTSPYGFIGKLQGMKCKDNLIDSCMEIVSILMQKPEGIILKDQLIELLVNSENYAQSNDRTKVLIKCESFTEKQLNYLLYGLITNSQVHGAWDARSFIYDLVVENEDLVISTLSELFNDLINSNWDQIELPEYPLKENVDEMVIQTILRDRPKLSDSDIYALVQEQENLYSIPTFLAILEVIENLGIRYL